MPKARDVDAAFVRLVTTLSADDVPIELPLPGAPRKFGSGAVRIGGKIFAMLVRGHLVVKLPAARVSALVAAGHGTWFDANKGKPMKEWFVIGAATRRPTWLALAREARAFVGR